MNPAANSAYTPPGSIRPYFFVCFWIVLSTIGILPRASATAIATGSINVTDLLISPASGVATFDGPWTAQTYAEAKNSSCGCDSQFDSSVGGVAQADAMVMFAEAHSRVDASALTLAASGDVNIPGTTLSAASATARWGPCCPG